MEQLYILMPPYLRKCPWYMHVHSYDFLQALQTQMRGTNETHCFKIWTKDNKNVLSILYRFFTLLPYQQLELLPYQLLLILLCSYCINTSNLIKCIWICEPQQWQIMFGETEVRRRLKTSTQCRLIIDDCLILLCVVSVSMSHAVPVAKLVDHGARNPKSWSWVWFPENVCTDDTMQCLNRSRAE